MLDAKLLRSDLESIKQKLAKRNLDIDFSVFLDADKRRRELLSVSEEMKSRQNAVSKKIPQMKKNGEDVSGVMSEMKEISDKVKAYDEELKEIEEKIENFLLTVPNTPFDLVPGGATDADNFEVRRWGTPPVFEGEAEPHWDIGTRLDIIEQPAAAKVTGARFSFLKGMGAALERAIISLMLDTHIKNGYTEIMPPYIVHRRSMFGTGQLPKFEEDMFKLAGTDYFLIPTAEVPVTNIHREQILDRDDLTIKYCAYSACFRAEAGSAGRDTRGLIRQHQFNKVELVKFAHPDESYAELETLTADAEKILQLLGISYRVVRLCGGDLGFCSAMTYDIEVWMPSYNRYVEISSCSNFEDFQARRAGIRFKDGPDSKPAFVHTLNGSGLAVGRTFAAILENFKQPDGSVLIPEVLRGYMGGVERIG